MRAIFAQALPSFFTAFLHVYSDHLRPFFSKPVLWSPSYCILSCGGAPLEIIRQYIAQQDRPDD